LATGSEIRPRRIPFGAERKAARPKDGRPLQNPPPARPSGFVTAFPSRAFQDGMGIFGLKLSRGPEFDLINSPIAVAFLPLESLIRNFLLHRI
jgi:hypothetical protein